MLILIPIPDNFILKYRDICNFGVNFMPLVIAEELLPPSFIIDVSKLIFVGSTRLSPSVVRNVGKHHNGIMVVLTMILHRRIRKSYPERPYLHCIIWRRLWRLVRCTLTGEHLNVAHWCANISLLIDMRHLL